jgi:hypothetical protein
MQSAGSAREYVTNGQPSPDPSFTYHTFHLQPGAPIEVICWTNEEGMRFSPPLALRRERALDVQIEKPIDIAPLRFAPEVIAVVRER